MKAVRLLGALTLVCALAACALSLKQKAVAAAQITETTLETAQDIERTYCFNVPAQESGPHCTNPQAATLKLTDERHQKFARLFSTAFADQIKVATALQAWDGTAAAPNSVSTYQADVTAILTLAQELDPAATAILTESQQLVNEAAQIALLVGAKP